MDSVEKCAYLQFFNNLWKSINLIEVYVPKVDSSNLSINDSAQSMLPRPTYKFNVEPEHGSARYAAGLDTSSEFVPCGS